MEYPQALNLPSTGVGPTTDPTPAVAPSTPSTASPTTTTTTTKSQSRSRQANPSLYERVGTTIGLIFTLALAGGLWYAGSYFSLQFLGKVQFLHISQLIGLLGLRQWFIPVGITAIELFLWPRRKRFLIKALVFFPVLAFDIGTSCNGLIDVTAGSTIPLFQGITIPKDGVALNITVIIFGLLFAFGPEKIARWVVADLIELWGLRRIIKLIQQWWKGHVWKAFT